MTEDAYRAELIHAWRIQRMNEAIDACRQARFILQQDIEEIRANMEKHDSCMMS